MVFEGIIENMGNTFVLNIFLAIGILLFGILLGKLVEYILSKIVKATDLEKELRPSFLKLIIAVIKWSIYILFINLSLNRFSIPQLSDIVTKVLVVVPALTSALVLIGIGFAVAIYLRKVIEDSQVAEWKTFSTYIYYFVLYVFGVYALNLALISIDSLFRNILVVLLTAIVGVSIAFISIRRSSKF
jgi:hypothetical protein